MTRTTEATRASWRHAHDRRQKRRQAGIARLKRPRGEAWSAHQLGAMLVPELVQRLGAAAESLCLTRDTIAAQAIEAFVLTLEARFGPFGPPPLEYVPPRGEVPEGAVRVTWRVPEELDERLELAAAGMKQTKRALIAEALERHLDAVEIVNQREKEA